MSENRESQIRFLTICFAVLSLAWLIVYWPALSSMVGVWYASDTFTHCFIIAPVVVYLLYERRHEISQTNLKPCLFAVVPLIFTQGVYLAAQLLGVNLIAHVSAYASLVLIVWMVFGTAFMLRFKFPFIFLVFVVPFGEELVPWLQDVTAHMSVVLLQWTNVPIYREGLYLYVPNGTFLVAEACAGIRFLIAAVALGTLYAYMNFTTKWKFIAFIAISFIVPVVANGFRAYGIVLIGYFSDMEHATGADHLVYGWFFFAFVLVLLFLLGEMFKEKVSLVKKEQVEALGVVTKPSAASVFLMLFVVTGVQIYGALFIFSEYKVDTVKPLASVLANIDSQARTKQVRWQPQMVNAHETWSGNLLGRDSYIAKYHFDNDDAELVSGLNRAFNIDTFSRVALKTHQVGMHQVAIVDIVDVGGRKVSLAYWYEVDGVRSISPLKTKINQVKSKLSGNAGKGYFVAVSLKENDAIEAIMNSLPALP